VTLAHATSSAGRPSADSRGATAAARGPPPLSARGETDGLAARVGEALGETRDVEVAVGLGDERALGLALGLALALARRGRAAPRTGPRHARVLRLRVEPLDLRARLVDPLLYPRRHLALQLARAPLRILDQAGRLDARLLEQPLRLDASIMLLAADDAP